MEPRYWSIERARWVTYDLAVGETALHPWELESPMPALPAQRESERDLSAVEA